MMRIHYISGLTLLERHAIQERAKQLKCGVDLLPGNDLRIWCYKDDVPDNVWAIITAELDMLMGTFEGTAM